MSIFIDTVTFIWAIAVLFAYSNWVVVKRGAISFMGFLAAATYLIAQSGWTTAFLLGDVWGRDFSNYIWFVFNSLVFGILTILWIRNRTVKKK
jgi:hypothetical protein